MPRRFPYASTLLLAAVLGVSGWIAARSLAGDGTPDHEEIRHVAERIHGDRTATGKRIDQLTKLREQLVETDASAAQLALLDDVIASEKAAQTDRERGIQEVAFAGRDRMELEDMSAIVESELFNIADAIDGLDQSYHISAVRSCTAGTGGSQYNDPDERPETIEFRGDSKDDRIVKLREKIEQLRDELEALDAGADADEAI